MASLAGNTDFIDSALADLGVSVTRTPVTKAVDNDGDETLTTAATNAITVVFYRQVPQFFQEKEGLREKADGWVMFSHLETLNKEDLIEFEGRKYRVGRVVARGLPRTGINLYQYAPVFLHEQ